jgi:glycosyltransferase involved in cell wall biosynthesis
MKTDLKTIAGEVSRLLGSRILPSNIQELPLAKEFSPRRAKHFHAKGKAGEAYHLTLAEDLSDVLPKLEGFHSAYPTLSVRPVGIIDCGGYQILVQGHFNGSPLSNLVESGKAGAEETNEILLKLHSAVGKGIKKSSKKAASAELKEFCSKFLDVKVLAPLDKELIQSLFLPVLQDQLLPGLGTKRWINGDLTASNIMVSPDGNLGIIDCEFAKETHFFHEDWIRLGTFSHPTISHTPAYSHIRREIPPSFEAYFWMRQILLADKAFPVSKARQLCANYFERCFDVLVRLGLVSNSPSLLVQGLKEAGDVAKAQLAHERAINAQPSLSDPTQAQKLIELFTPHIIGPLGKLELSLVEAEGRIGEGLANLCNSFHSALFEHAKTILEKLQENSSTTVSIADSFHSALFEQVKSIVEEIRVQSANGSGILTTIRSDISKSRDEVSSAMENHGAAQFRSIRELVELTSGLKDTITGQMEAQKTMASHYQGMDGQLTGTLDLLHNLLAKHSSGGFTIETEVGARRELANLLKSQYNQALATLQKLQALDIPGMDIGGFTNRILEKLEGDFQSFLGKMDQIENALGEAIGRNNSLSAHLADTQLHLIVHADKIRRMENSFSWRVTSPLRFLRRKILDKGKPLRAVDLEEASEDLFPVSQPTDPYTKWIELFENQDVPPKPGIRPKISILMPVFKPDHALFAQAIRSIQSQSYPNWELCLADDCSGDPVLWEIIQGFAKDEPRVKATRTEKNSHISKTTNQAASLATGEYVAFMDHDDLLSKDALLHVIAAMETHPGAKLFYSDEDKVTPDGIRHSPHFKTDWNPQLLLSQNYLCHFVVMAAGVFQELGGLREGYEGSQDWDLLLRAMDKLDATEIVHIPKVLYHWRESPGSTAASTDSKPYAKVAATKALEDFYRRNGLRAHVGVQPNGYFITERVLEDDPSLTIIIPTRNGGQVLRRCLDSLYKQENGRQFDILVIDNGSDEKSTLDLLQDFKRKKQNFCILRDESPFNYSKLNNKAVQSVATELVLLLNDDTEILTADWLDIIKANASRPEVGAVGAKLLYPDDTIQHAGVILGVGGVAGHGFKRLTKNTNVQFNRANLPHYVSAVTAAFLCIRREVYNEVGGLDGENLRIAFNDIDFCLKVGERGYHNLYLPEIVLRHYESYSRGMEDTLEKQARFAKEVRFMRDKWGSLLDNDPYYSPNLSLHSEQFHIRTVPGNAYQPV